VSESSQRFGWAAAVPRMIRRYRGMLDTLSGALHIRSLEFTAPKIRRRQ